MDKHVPRKRFGQHFLTAPQVIAQLIQAIDPKAADHIVEIGPGTGALTQHLLPLGMRLDAIEIDRDLFATLKKLSATFPQFKVHNSDVLRFDFSTLVTNSAQLRIVGNLPYNISTPLLFHLFNYLSHIQDMHFMLQKEVVDRMAAAPGGHAYGRLSVMVQYHCAAETLFNVGAEAFDPPPKVESAVVRLRPHSSPPALAQDYTHFSNLVRHAFTLRRKKLSNALKGLVSTEKFAQANIDPTLRPEEITVEGFVALSNITQQANLINSEQNG